LAADLATAGLPGDTPALLAENVSQPDQRLTRSTVGALAADLVAPQAGGAPALILYGPLAWDGADG
jgi:uroporphyrin-III C-methyltransferase